MKDDRDWNAPSDKYLQALEKAAQQAEENYTPRLLERVNMGALMRTPRATVPEEQTKWAAYFALMLQNRGQIWVTYEKSKSTAPYGRVYARNAMSLQGFSHDMRVAVASGIYNDIDMVNCHPRLCAHLCNLLAIPCPVLNDYILNREDRLKELNMPRAEAKTVFLSLMYGGAIPDKCKTVPFVVNFANELTHIAHLISKQYPTIRTNNKDRPEFSRLSIKLQTMENELLMKLIVWFRKEGYEPGVLLFDGLWVYAKRDPVMDKALPMDPAVLRRCEVELGLITEYGIMLEEKIW
jgi:hypothetical protein